MSKRISSLVLAAALVTASGAFAADKVNLTDEVKQQITEKLTAEGYEVAKIQIEDGLYEAYARKDGKRLEVFLDAALEVVRTEVND